MVADAIIQNIWCRMYGASQVNHEITSSFTLNSHGNFSPKPKLAEDYLI